MRLLKGAFKRREADPVQADYTQKSLDALQQLGVTYYKVTPPYGETFYAACREGGADVYSTRANGKREFDEKLEFYDLMMPEQDLLEWDVHSIDESQAPAPLPVPNRQSG